MYKLGMSDNNNENIGNERYFNFTCQEYLMFSYYFIFSHQEGSKYFVRLKKSLRVRPGSSLKCKEMPENIKLVRRLSGVLEVGGEGLEGISAVQTTMV